MIRFTVDGCVLGSICQAGVAGLTCPSTRTQHDGLRRNPQRKMGRAPVMENSAVKFTMWSYRGLGTYVWLLSPIANLVHDPLLALK